MAAGLGLICQLPCTLSKSRESTRDRNVETLAAGNAKDRIEPRHHVTGHVMQFRFTMEGPALASAHPSNGHYR